MTVEKRKDFIIRTHTNYEKTILTFSEQRIMKLPAPMDDCSSREQLMTLMMNAAKMTKITNALD